MLKKTEEKYKISEQSRIKFVETSGRKYVDQLRVNDPFDTNCSPNENCLACKDNIKPSNCKISNVGCSLICKMCKRRGINRTYEGETCRNVYLPGQEHMKNT